MLGAVIYSVGLAGFLAGTLIAAILTDDGLGDATGGRTNDIPCSGNCRGEAARAGGKSRDDTFGHAAYGDWPAIPEDLKFHAHHSAGDTK